MSRFLILLPILFIHCRNKYPDDGNSELPNAKWHFYSYANILTAYNLTDTVNPLDCSLSLVKSVKGSAADRIYFKAFYKDTNRVFRFRPFNLDGVAVTKSNIYIPMFHTLEFDDPENDSLNLIYMHQMEKLLIEKIRENPDRINPWLRIEAKRRGVIN